jgi:hypothetical protein
VRPGKGACCMQKEREGDGGTVGRWAEAFDSVGIWVI